MGISSHLHISTKMRESFVLSFFLLHLYSHVGGVHLGFFFWVVEDVIRLWTILSCEFLNG